MLAVLTSYSTWDLKTALRARNQAHRPGLSVVAGKSQKRGREGNVAGSTHGKGLTRLRRGQPPAPAAAAARGGRRGRHGARGICARKGQVPPASAPASSLPTAQIPSLGSAVHTLLPGKLASDVRRVPGRTALLHPRAEQGFAPSAPLSTPSAVPHQSQQRSRMAPPPEGATVHQ